MRFQRRNRLAVDGVAGPQNAARARPPRTAAARQPRVQPRRPGLGRGDAPVPALRARLLARRRRRRLRAGHRAAVDGASSAPRPRRSTARRRQPDDPRAAAPRAAGASRLGPVRFHRPRRRADRRRLRLASAAAATRASTSRSRRHARRRRRPRDVDFAGCNTGGYGNLVVVRHRLGFASWYAHLSRIAVRAGQAVSGGTRARLRGLDRALDRAAPALRGAPLRHAGRPVPYLLPGAARVRLGPAALERAPAAPRPHGAAR